MSKAIILTNIRQYTDEVGMAILAERPLHQLIDNILDFQAFIIAGLTPQDAVWLIL